MADQISIRLDETNVAAGSAVVATVNFRTRATASASTPSSIRYRVDCLTTKRALVEWTSVSAASSASITIPGTSNAIVDEDNETERRQITVEIDAELSTQVRGAATWTVRNIRTFPVFHNFPPGLQLEPFYAEADVESGLTIEHYQYPVGHRFRYLDTFDVVDAHYYRRTAAEISAAVTPTHFGYPPGDVRRYGAVGDGVTDDGPAVRNDALQESEDGWSIELTPSNTYLCTTWTALDTGDPMRVHGFGSTLKGPSIRADFARPSATVLLNGATFDRWQSVLEREAANGGTITRLRMFDGRITDTSSIAVNIEVACSNYHIRGWTFDNIDGVEALRIGRNTFAEQDNWYGGHVTDLAISDVDVPGSSDGGAILLYGHSTHVNGVSVDDLTGSSSGELWGIYNKLRYSTVSGCTVRNLTGNSASVWAFNHKGLDRSGTGSPNGYSNRYWGNYAGDITGTSTGGYGHRHQQENFVSFGHIAEDCTGSGYSIDYSEDVTGVTNASLFGFIARNTTAGTSVGVRVSTCLSNVHIDNFITQGHILGVRLAAIRGEETDWRVTNGTIDTDATSGQGVVVRRDEDLDGLLLANLRVKSANQGIRYETGTGVLSNVHQLDCDLTGSTTPISGTLPGDFELRHCWKFQTTAAGPTTALTLSLGDEASYAIELRAVAVLNDGAEQNMYHREALFFRNGGNATIVGTVQDIGTPQEITAAWDATLDASTTTVRVRLTGEASHTINWKLWIHVLGVSAA